MYFYAARKITDLEFERLNCVHESVLEELMDEYHVLEWADWDENDVEFAKICREILVKPAQLNIDKIKMDYPQIKKNGKFYYLVGCEDNVSDGEMIKVQIVNTGEQNKETLDFNGTIDEFLNKYSLPCKMCHIVAYRQLGGDGISELMISASRLTQIIQENSKKLRKNEIFVIGVFG